MRLPKREAIDAVGDEDTIVDDQDVELADLKAWATEAWVVVRRHSGRSWAADLHVRETFLVRLLLRF